MTVQTGPCDPWTTEAEVLAGDWELPSGLSGTEMLLAITAASDAMFQLGGQRWPGLCSRWIRPTDCSCLCYLPYPEGGIVAMRPHGRGACCHGGTLLDLGVYPLVHVWEIKLDGVGLATGYVRIHKDRYLDRIDGHRWPCVGENLGEVPAIEVNIQFGAAPPALGRFAATALARELLLAMAPGDGCRLDRRVQTIVREQVTMDFAIPGLAATLRDGQTGIPEVDLFVHVHNPSRLRRAARFIGL